MQTLLFVALGLVSGSALIVGSVYLAAHPPGFLKKPLMADPIDRPEGGDGSAIVYASASGEGGDGGGH